MEYIDIKQLVKLRNNPRTIKDESFKKLCDSIKSNPDFFEARPILVSNRTGENVIIGGNQRYEAAKSLGLNKVPCHIFDNLTEDKEREIIIRDNVNNGEWDFELLADEWNVEDLIQWDVDLPVDFSLQQDDEIQLGDELDEIPAEPINPITKLGDVWLLGNHRLMCGDSTMLNDVEKLMNGNTPDLIFTDPPYGINVNTNTSTNQKAGNGVAKKNAFGKILNDESTNCARNCYNLVTQLFLDCKLIMWGANYYDFLPPSKCWLSWYKKDNLPSDSFCDTELAYTNYNLHSKTLCVQWRGMIKEGEWGQSRVHPTQKPVMLAEKSFNYVVAGEIILDLFGGSGSTLIACEQTNRINYSMELDPKYCDVIIQRWQNYTKKDAILESTRIKYNDYK